MCAEFVCSNRRTQHSWTTSRAWRVRGAGPDLGGVSEGIGSVPGMRIDCGTCTVRGVACADCVVTFLTIGVREPDTPGLMVSEVPAAPVDLDDAERAAIDVLASSGLVPPLRLSGSG